MKRYIKKINSWWQQQVRWAPWQQAVYVAFMLPGLAFVWMNFQMNLYDYLHFYCYKDQRYYSDEEALYTAVKWYIDYPDQEKEYKNCWPYDDLENSIKTAKLQGPYYEDFELFDLFVLMIIGNNIIERSRIIYVKRCFHTLDPSSALPTYVSPCLKAYH